MVVGGHDEVGGEAHLAVPGDRLVSFGVAGLAGGGLGLGFDTVAQSFPWVSCFGPGGNTALQGGLCEELEQGLVSLQCVLRAFAVVGTCD